MIQNNEQIKRIYWFVVYHFLLSLRKLFSRLKIMVFPTGNTYVHRKCSLCLLLFARYRSVYVAHESIFCSASGPVFFFLRLLLFYPFVKMTVFFQRRFSIYVLMRVRSSFAVCFL